MNETNCVVERMCCIKTEAYMFSPHNTDFRSKHNLQNNLTSSLYFVLFYSSLRVFSSFLFLSTSTPVYLGCGDVLCVLLGGLVSCGLIVVNLVIWFTNIKVIEFYLNFHISFSLIHGTEMVVLFLCAFCT